MFQQTHFNSALCDIGGDQGDQIGRLFAYWKIVYFGHFFVVKQLDSVE
jgi:hypothetical protein